MKVIRFVIIVAIFGCCILPIGCDAEKNNDYIVAPNAFTINGEDDFFEVTTEDGVGVVSLKIFTRAGVMIFSIEAKRCIWDGCSLDGKQMAAGVYYYTAEIRGSSPKISKNGFVYLYR